MNRSLTHKTGIMVLCVMLLTANLSFAQSTFDFLGEFFVHSISADGTAAAGVASNDTWEALRWTETDGIELLGMNALTIVGRTAGVATISNDGKHISATIASADSTLVTQGLWTLGQRWQETMPPIPPDGGILDDSVGSAWGLSGDGTTVVGLYWRPGASDGSAHACSWTAEGGLIGLGSQGRGSRANAANYDGSVVVGYSKQPDWGGPQPTVWEDGTMAVLSAWDRGGELRSVNSDGSILTGYVYDPDTGFSPATLWKKEDSIWRTISLGVLPGTQPVYGTGISLAVTDDGNTVVGTNRFSMTNYGGFVWTASEGMMSPADFFAANQVSVSEDFVVISFSDISPDGNIIVGYGFDSSVWNAPITSFVVHLNQVTAVPNALVQGTLNLGPACPNPFNPSTSFDLTIEQSGSMRVEIFDARGRLVRILHDGILAEGSHSLTWNGRTSTGRLAGSGVYLARASNALGEAVTRRMTLVK